MKITKTALSKCKKSELVALAEKNDLPVNQSMKKDEIIKLICDSQGKESTEKSSAKKMPQIKRDAVEKDSSVCDVSSENTFSEFNRNDAGATGGIKKSDYSGIHVDNHSTLPETYNVTKIVLMVRDPYWAYTYWDIDSNKQSEIDRLFGQFSSHITPVLRVHDITNVDFNGSNSNLFWDIDVDLNARSWYVRLNNPGKIFIIDLGLRHADGRFFMIARSNASAAPIDGPSDVVDERWMITDFYELYASLIQGMKGLSSREIIQHRLELEEWGGRRGFEMPSSEFLSSYSSAAMVKAPAQKQKDFFLEVDADFILYGRTRPDAKLIVEGKPVKLRPDGTFTLRYHYPDGKRDLPVIAVSCDGEDTRKITVRIKKDTE